MEALSIRTELTDREMKTLERLQKGYRGEQLYDRILDEVGHDSLHIFRDIWIKADKSLTQIDSLIVSDDRIIINEVKNYSGLYIYDKNIWHIGNIQISDDPLIQVRRSSSKLIKIFRENNVHMDVDHKVVFPDPYFMLSTEDQSCMSTVIKRDMLKTYIRGLNQHSIGRRSEQIIKLLETYTVPGPVFEQVTDFKRLKRGRYCIHCKTYEIESFRGFTICRECHGRTDNAAHILRAVNDFQTLFHGEDVTAPLIQCLLGDELSSATIRRHLRQHCTPESTGRFRTYALKGPAG